MSYSRNIGKRPFWTIRYIILCSLRNNARKGLWEAEQGVTEVFNNKCMNGFRVAESHGSKLKDPLCLETKYILAQRKTKTAILNRLTQKKRHGRKWATETNVSSHRITDIAN